MARTAVLFQTHFFDRWAHAALKRLQAGAPTGLDFFVLIHLPSGVPVPERLQRVPHHVVRTPELRAMPYPAKVDGPDWNLWHDGHTDLITFHFCQTYPEYERYWTIEYDVAFSGRWANFFAAFAEDGADLLAPVVFRRRDMPDWIFWPSLVTPGQGPGDSQALRSFMPIFRMSRRLYEAADEAYRAGWGGHLECTLATIASLRAMSVGDIGNDGEFTAAQNRGRFYTSSRFDMYLAPGTLVFKPVLYRAGSRADMLWHPVKPFWIKAEARSVLLTWRSHWATVLRNRMPWLLRARWREPGSFSDSGPL
jgi:hypothetical protein